MTPAFQDVCSASLPAESLVVLAELSCLPGAAVARRGCEMLLLGRKLPALARGERFWGNPLFVPLGWRPEPEFPSEAWREVLGLTEGEFLFFTAAGAEVIAREVFQPLSRSSLR